jgi:hypothetical protein
MVGHNPVMSAMSKSPIVKRLTRLVFLGWLAAIILAGLTESSISDFWPKLELPLGILFYGLWRMRPPSKKHSLSLSILLIAVFVYREALPHPDGSDLITFLVYPLLSLAIAFYIVYHVYKLVEKQQQSPSDKEQTTPPSPDRKQRGAEVDSSLRSE